MSDETTFSLESFQQAAEKKYGTKMVVSLPGGKKTELRSPFKLSDDKRQKAFEIMENMNSAAETEDSESEGSASDMNEQVPFMRDLLRAVGDDNTPDLLEILEEDLGTLIEIFEQYQEQVKLGEAQPSPES